MYFIPLFLPDSIPVSFAYNCRGYYDFSQKFATQCIRRFRPLKVCIFLISVTRRVDLAMSVWPSVLKLSGWNFPKSLLSFPGGIQVGTSLIGQLCLIAPIGIIGKINLRKVFLWCFLTYNLLRLEIKFFN